MPEALRRLLAEVIDYAGLFPPARLDMPAAVDAYRRYRQGPERWILSRFVCPAGRLGELLEHLPGDHEQWPIAVIGSIPGADWRGSLDEDARAMGGFETQAAGKAAIEALELRLPGGVAPATLLQSLRGFSGIDVFVELSLDESLPENLIAVAKEEVYGVKVRTGGLEPEAFPSSERLAGFLHECVSLDLSFKLTAGLHHPFPRPDPEMGARMHGFINVLGAVALAIGEDLSRKEIAEALEDDRPSAWTIRENGIRWRGHSASSEAIDEARSLFCSFGSCSVEEPLRDLATAGLR